MYIMYKPHMYMVNRGRDIEEGKDLTNCPILCERPADYDSGFNFIYF